MNLLLVALIGVVSVFISVFSLAYDSLAQATPLASVLTWQNADTVDQVQIDKGPAATGPFVKLSTVAPGVLTFTDSANSPGTTACYRVENFSSSGNGPSSNVACKAFPPVPTIAPVLAPIP